MTISFVVAASRNLVIGNEQGLPWHLPSDLKRFRRLTLDKPIVMGRTTFERIGHPLDRRLNIVLSRRPDYRAEGCVVAHSPREAFALAGAVPEVMVIGGAKVFESTFQYANRVYLTWIEGKFEGTAHFRPPEAWPCPTGEEWVVRHREVFPQDSSNAYAQEYLVYERQAVAKRGTVPVGEQQFESRLTA